MTGKTSRSVSLTAIFHPTLCKIVLNNAPQVATPENATPNRPGEVLIGYHGGAKWATWSIRQRCQIVSRARGEIASRVDQLTHLSRSEQRTDDAETVASELLPLCEALRWIGKHGKKTLAPRKVGWRGRPLWMWGVRSVVQRVPLGRVLILGTWNYPLLLPGVQMAQALAAGNLVCLKPAAGTEAVSAELIAAFYAAGVPKHAITLLNSTTEAAIEAQASGVDLVVLTGSAETGRKVLHQSAENLTPCIMELSGADAAIVLPQADLARVVDAVTFGLLFNSGATCIGPRRLMIQTDPSTATLPERLIDRLRATNEVTLHPAARASIADLLDDVLRKGAKDSLGRYDSATLRTTGKMHAVVLENVPEGHAILQSDVFAPVISIIPVQRPEQAIQMVNECPYRLAASVFGPTSQTQSIGKQLTVGVVTINDLVAPTADPRLPFGGRGQSGFGVTRGPEGLLAMTTPRVIATRRGRVAMHLSPRNDADAELLSGVLQWSHSSGWTRRRAALRRVTTAAAQWRALKK
ncbi:aldehyde dehydrogenase family protein [Rhodopirellula sp. P2]|uniref:aldehyde dehydrogenase family protein n=1 Tax=Rhodopirellula sp. P2 TaxID=2127060 RepID=UPI00236749C5|nr:aldehyde dehydrogenase family protein [Rhodopirellula sp. P2]WDQ16900.1 aldehyde dehydrogenase family protein [Rhodopirellula sp. P2]